MNMDQIIIKDLLARGIIGINESERTQPQDILINIVIFADLQKAGQTDNIDESVNYRTVAKNSIELAANAHRLTVEALAADIAEMVLRQPNAKTVRVRVEKPGAVRFARSVGVEIERSAPVD
jgi:FolB domain-containing protein